MEAQGNGRGNPLTLSEISIKNPVFAWMLMCALILFGLLSYRGLGISNMPDVDFPVISVTATWEGAAPDVMESDVTDVLEDAVMGISGIRDLSSATRQGISSLTIQFNLDKNIDDAFREVQAKISEQQIRLPRDLDPAVISKVSPTDNPIMWLAVTADLPTKQMMSYVQDHLKDQFQTISGVGDIILGGYVDRNLRVWVSSEKLAQYDLTVNDVIDAIESNHVERPAGRIETDTKEMNVRAFGEAKSPEEFSEILITKRAGQPVYVPIKLSELSVVEDGLADIRRISRSNGKPAVGLGIRKQRGTNAVAVAEKVKKKMKEIKPTLPQGMDIAVNFDSTRFAKEAIDELIFTLILSALLTSVVCWFFLGSLTSTLNVLMAIPTSIIGTFLVFRFFGFTLNTFTVLGLTLAIGIVVDDAIMVLENIVRYREKGLDRVNAALTGARQITFAAWAATLSLVAIFLPVAFMKGVIGKFFFQFGVTISAAVLISLLEALTLTPMRASQFLSVENRTKGFGGRIETMLQNLRSAYAAALDKALSRRFSILIVAAIVFALSLFLFGRVRKEFVPSQDQSMFLCRLETPVGSSITFTDSRFKEVEKFVSSRPEVHRYYAAVGGFGGGEVNSGMLFISLKHKNERPLSDKGKPLTQSQVINDFRKELNKIPDCKAFVQDLSTMGFSARRGFPIEFTIRGPDWIKLSEYSKQMMDRLDKTGLVRDLDSDYRTGLTEVQIIPNRQEARSKGVSMASLADTINAMIGGLRVGKYTEHGRRYDVRVKLAKEASTDPSVIEQLKVWNNRGEIVQVKDVARIDQKPSLLSISRKDRERAIEIYANIAEGKSQSDVLDSVFKVGKEVLPEGYHLVLSGAASEFKESFSSLFFALWLGVIIAYMILASQFNSYVHPITVLLALPFSISGALLSLWMTGLSLNIYSFIGLILLMGIVKKNSILLVEFTDHVRAESGKDARQALLEACPVRLRPILMTSFSTIAAALPAALAVGPGSETRIPMAVTVIGGVLLSTFLTLFVVPCAYSAFTVLEKKNKKI